jgi:hypothetical protein
VSVTGDLVTLAGGTTERVYPMGKVPSAPTYPYRVIGYSPNVPVTRTQNGDGDPLRRFVVQHFGRSADSVEAVADASFATFDGQRVDGDVCTQEIATPITRDPDDSGVLSTTHTYRY